MVSVLLSASVERFNVSCMRDSFFRDSESYMSHLRLGTKVNSDKFSSNVTKKKFNNVRLRSMRMLARPLKGCYHSVFRAVLAPSGWSRSLLGWDCTWHPGTLPLNLHFILHSLHYTALSTLHCTLYTTLHSLHYTTLSTLHYTALSTLHCTLYTTLHSLDYSPGLHLEVVGTLPLTPQSAVQ